MFKQRVIDCFQLGWSGSVNESPVLTIYQQRVYALLWVWTRFRPSPQPLNMFRLQSVVVYTSIAHANRSLCQNSNTLKRTILSSMRHNRYIWWASFTCVCPSIYHIRERYIKLYYYRSRSVFKYLEVVKITRQQHSFRFIKFCERGTTS